MERIGRIDYSKYDFEENILFDFFKRIIDIVLASILFIMVLPFILIFCLVIYLETKESPFFFQSRTGKDNRVFYIIKIRTMKPGAEELSGPVWAIRNDPRCTGAGSFLRKTSIDELPQLVNIIKGEMTFVGPRPERPELLDAHPLLKGMRLKVKPGLTGLAQVNGRYMLTLEEKIMFDLEYIHNRNLWLDFKIMLKTIPVVLSMSGAW